MTINDFTLRSTMERHCKFYTERYGQPRGQWPDEWLSWIIKDYAACKGGLEAFTDDDWKAAEESGLTKEKVTELLQNNETIQN